MKWGKPHTQTRPPPSGFQGDVEFFALWPIRTIDGWVWLESYLSTAFHDGNGRMWEASTRYRLRRYVK